MIKVKREWYFAIGRNMNVLEGYYARWDKSERQRKTDTVWYHLFVESKKYNRLVNITEKKAHRGGEQTSSYQCGVEGTNYWM